MTLPRSTFDSREFEDLLRSYQVVVVEDQLLIM